MVIISSLDILGISLFFAFTHTSLPKVRIRMSTADFLVYTTLLHIGQQIFPAVTWHAISYIKYVIKNEIK